MSVPRPSTRARFLATAGAAGIAAAALVTVAGAPAHASGGGGGSGFDIEVSSAIAVDPTRETVTLPLLQGTHAGQAVYYVVTDDSDKNDAQARGVNWAPKLANALGTAAVQRVTSPGGVVEFPGIVDFAPTRSVVPGPAGNEFAGGTYAPGAVGDATYSPLVTTGNGIVLNATQVADASGLHDSVVAIDYARHRVTLYVVLRLLERPPDHLPPPRRVRHRSSPPPRARTTRRTSTRHPVSGPTTRRPLRGPPSSPSSTVPSV